MWNDFTLNLISPGTIINAGRMDQVLEIARLIEDESLKLEDGTYLSMSARYTNDSSYMRTSPVCFPICMTIRRLRRIELKEKTAAQTYVTLWKKHEDPRCLVMFDQRNTPENNFEGDYQAALEWIIDKVRTRFQ